MPEGYFDRRQVRYFFGLLPLIFVLLIIVASVANAASDRNTQLGRGLDILSTFRGANPQAGVLYDKLKDRMPADVKAGEGKSDWLKNRAITSKQDLKSKLNDKSLAVIKGGDGRLYAIPRRDMSGVLQSSIDHALAQPDFDKIYSDALSKIPPAEMARLREKLGSKAGILDSPSVLRGIVNGANNLNSEMPDFLQIDSPVGDIAIGILGPTLEDYRDKLRDDLANGNPIPGIDLPVTADADTATPPKSESKPEDEKSAGDTETAGAAPPQDNQTEKNAAEDKRRRMADTVARLEAGFGVLDTAISQLETAVQGDLALCRKAQNAKASGSEMDRIAQESKRRLSQFTNTKTVDTIDHKPVYEQLKGLLKAIKLANESARDAASQACKAGEDAAANAALGKEQALRGRNHAVLADQLKNTAKAIADPLIARLSAPIPFPSPQEFDAKRAEAYTPLKNYCQALSKELQPYFKKVSDGGSLVSHWQKSDGNFIAAEKVHSISTQALRDFGRDLDTANYALFEARLAGYKSRIEKLKRQAAQCTKDNANLVMITCAGKFNLTETGYRDTEQFTKARKKIIDRRKLKLAVIRDALAEIESNSRWAREKADKARACFQQAEAKADEKQKADACDKANKAITSARSKLDGDDVAGAQADLKNSDIANCPAVQNDVADIQDQINQRNDAGSVQQAQTAVGSCDLNDLNRAIGSLAGAKSDDAKTLRRKLQDKARALGRIEGLIYEATSLTRRNEPEQARTRLGRANQELASLGGGAACAPLQTRIAEANASIVDQASQNVTACTAAKIKINRALQQYHKGNNSQAQRLLDAARSDVSGVPAGQCGNIHDRINNGVQVVARAAGAARAANAAINTCNEEAISRWKARFEGSNHRAKGKMIARLSAAKRKCGRTRARDEARRQREQARRDRNAANQECVQLNGPGYYAGKKLPAGNYACVPNRRTANAWCRANRGRGMVAGKIRANGTYNCRRTARANSQQAWAACRRRYPNSLVDVKVYRSGKYRCITRTVRRQPPPPPQPQHRSSDSAAVIGGILGTIDRLGRNRQNRDRFRPAPRRRTGPAVRPRPRRAAPRPRSRPRACQRGYYNKPVRCPTGKRLFIGQTSKWCRYTCG